MSITLFNLYSQSQANSIQEVNDLYDTPLVDSVKVSLIRCYYTCIGMKSKEGEVLEAYRIAGREFYERAYNYYLQLQLQLGDDLPSSKRHLVSEALKLYSDIFNNKYAMSNDFFPKVESMHENVQKFPYETSKIEEDFLTQTFRVTSPIGSKQKIGLPDKGNYCLWEINGDEQIQMEGSFPNNGYGAFSLNRSMLPIYLGAFKEFIVTGGFKNVELVFKPCERN